jgi:hypothetical protein
MQIQVNNDFNNSGRFLTQDQINSFLQDEQTAINILDAAFTDTVVFDVGLGSFQGQTMNNQLISLANINTNAVFFMSYSQLRTNLLTFGQPGLFNAANLPNVNSINGVSNFWVSSSAGACFGLFTNQTDGYVGIGTDFAPGGERVSAFLHEFGHAMGRVPQNLFFNGQQYVSAFDLWRFTNPGIHLFDGNFTTNTSAYFSLDGAPGETDLMLRNNKTGGMVIYDISNNQITNAVFIGTVGLDWQFAGIAPIHSPGASDLVLRNKNTGAFEVYDIAGNTLIGATLLGQVGLDWQLGGFAVDPPTGATGSSDDQPDSAAQLVQAMAGFGSNVADTSNAVPLGTEASQQQLLTTPQHA